MAFPRVRCDFPIPQIQESTRIASVHLRVFGALLALSFLDTGNRSM